MKKPKVLWNRVKLIFKLSFLVFFVTLTSLIGLSGSYYLIIKLPFLDIERLPNHSEQYILAIISLVIGIIASIILRRLFIMPLQKTNKAIDSISEGDYKVYVEPKGVKSVRIFAKKINNMAKELESIEIMRNDFVNSFSHEFKTPIVSISGFAKMLRDDKLTDEERNEYLDIIISESKRLAQLSTNILNVTKLDNQTILSDITEFNVTEQIRLAVVLLASKWTEKNITVNLDSDEYYISGNEETLKQLWINLIDNAVKYSPENSEISIDITEEKDNLIFTFTDSGDGMDEKTAKRAFDKFYQGDISHKSSGNGLGLPVAKKVCELHGGSIRIKSTGKEGTTFEVVLPAKHNVNN